MSKPEDSGCIQVFEALGLDGSLTRGPFVDVHYICSIIRTSLKVMIGREQRDVDEKMAKDES